MRRHLSQLCLFIACIACVGIPPALANIATGIFMVTVGSYPSGPPFYSGGTNTATVVYEDSEFTEANKTYTVTACDCDRVTLVSSNDPISYTWKGGPGNRILSYHVSYYQDNNSNPHDDSYVDTGVFYVNPPNKDILDPNSGCLSPYRAGVTNVDYSNAQPALMTANYNAGYIDTKDYVVTMFNGVVEENLTFTFPTALNTGWIAAGSANFTFDGSTITDNKSWGPGNDTDAAWFDGLAADSTIASYTQQNRIRYTDVCGNPKTQVLSTHTFTLKKSAQSGFNPFDGTVVRYIYNVAS